MLFRLQPPIHDRKLEAPTKELAGQRMTLLAALVALLKLCGDAVDVVHQNQLWFLMKMALTENKNRLETRRGGSMQRAEIQAKT
jgi:hypothetical protein